jgi:threonylcarbamoyladenosine tRNA methylthiotransferase MtaB
MYKVAFDTFGCRLNQAETATLHRQFLARGYEITDDPASADLFVLNTCTLTSQATSKCRRRLRAIIRRNPETCVAAIGCYSQTDAEKLKEIKGLDYIVGTADKLQLADIITTPVKLIEPLIVTHPVAGETFTIKGAGYYPRNTRANIKIQEGCDFVCAFCLVPRSRGRARSREFADILKEAQTLSACGHRELIITGVNIGVYRDGNYTLADVIRALADIDGLDRIRLSSIEPTTIEDDIIEQISAGGKICAYLHVPLQSGDDAVLERMRRKYDSQKFREFMEMAIDRVPGIGLGTDVMVGFPGEDEAAFERSLNMIRVLPYTNVHVFSFSARPRTTAFAMKDKVPASVIRERSAIMHRLADDKKTEYYKSQVGKRLRVIFEERDHAGRFIGFSDNYVKIAVETDADLSNHMTEVRVTGADDSGPAKFRYAIGEIVETKGLSDLEEGAGMTVSSARSPRA